ncbi:hypothetical protein [Mesorhizobium sp.]|uniref:hypothetical protein n=1 Tax=Mesorhizobium sp. TaxID=1871066 RepID=UPI0011F6BF7C|nr:hypothetical protein [Mesorhizobium sp.]TIL46116.1 MAG: hypothetical protein E5Y86_08425 [Mesorhizobium sp.]
MGRSIKKPASPQSGLAIPGRGWIKIVWIAATGVLAALTVIVTDFSKLLDFYHKIFDNPAISISISDVENSLVVISRDASVAESWPLIVRNKIDFLLKKPPNEELECRYIFLGGANLTPSFLHHPESFTIPSGVTSHRAEFSVLFAVSYPPPWKSLRFRIACGAETSNTLTVELQGLKDYLRH